MHSFRECVAARCDFARRPILLARKSQERGDLVPSVVPSLRAKPHHIRAEDDYDVPEAELEPAISSLGGRRLIH